MGFTNSDNPDQQAMAMMDDNSDAEDQGGGTQASFASVSNASDFSEDEEVDYLALEVVNYLPPEKSAKLMKNLRVKERAIQHLLGRNRSLLGTCGKLDQENQSASERCEELVKRVEALELEVGEARASAAAAEALAVAPPAAAAGGGAGAAGPAPVNDAAATAVTAAKASAPGGAGGAAPKVDTSYFLNMEKGKEERLLRLSAENERLQAHCRRSTEQVAQLEARIEEVSRDAKQSKKKLQEMERRGGAAGAGALGGGALGGCRGGGFERDGRQVGDPEVEEERLYQELQEQNKPDVATEALRQQMAQKLRMVMQTLEQVLHVDIIGAVSGWDSEVTALALQA